jgi:Tc5 transposase DNA-binding domain
MPISNNEIEKNVRRAISDLKTQKKPNIAATARKYCVPIDRVRRRFKGQTKALSTLGGHNKKLDKNDERVLYQYLDFYDNVSLPVREKSLSKIANSLLLRRHILIGSKDLLPKVSKVWSSRFLKRHPKYKKRTLKPLAIYRKNAHNLERIKR